MYLSNTALLIAERALRLSLLLVVSIFLTRHLGPADFGYLNYLVSFVGLFASVSALGLDGILVQRMVSEPANIHRLLGVGFALKLLGALLVSLLVVFAAIAMSVDKFSLLLMLLVASALFLDAFNVVDLYYQSKVKSKFPVIARVFQVLVSSLLKIYMIEINAGVNVFVILIAVDALVLMVSYLFVYRYVTGSILLWRWDSGLAVSLLRQSRHLILADVVISIYAKIDKVMLKELDGTEAVGLYSSASTLSEAWYYVSVAICGSLYPLLIAAKKHSHDCYLEKLQQLFNLMVWVALFVALPVGILGEWIILFIYGEEFKEAGAVLSLHVWSGVFVFLGMASGKWLLIEQKYGVVFARALSGLLVNVLLNYWWIPLYGIVGAACATVVSQSVNALFYDLLDRDSRPLFWMKIRAMLFLERRLINPRFE